MKQFILLISLGLLSSFSVAQVQADSLELEKHQSKAVNPTKIKKEGTNPAVTVILFLEVKIVP